VIYTLVPDSAGAFGIPHTRENLLARMPGVLAHEFAHLIHFQQRLFTAHADARDAGWLEEAIAHFAEENFAAALRQRGELMMSEQTGRPNYIRAALYLVNANGVSLTDSDDSIEVRGAGWLFVQYLAGRFGPQVVRTLMRSTEAGPANVMRVTGTSWEVLLHDWLVALYADDAPELGGVHVDSRFSFSNIHLRSAISGVTRSREYPLSPIAAGPADFVLSGELPASAGAFVMYRATRTTHLVLNETRGTTPEGRAGFTVLRLN
jgi:hypothetical protein